MLRVSDKLLGFVSSWEVVVFYGCCSELFTAVTNCWVLLRTIYNVLLFFFFLGGCGHFGIFTRLGFVSSSSRSVSSTRLIWSISQHLVSSTIIDLIWLLGTLPSFLITYCKVAGFIRLSANAWSFYVCELATKFGASYSSSWMKWNPVESSNLLPNLTIILNQTCLASFALAAGSTFDRILGSSTSKSTHLVSSPSAKPLASQLVRPLVLPGLLIGDPQPVDAYSINPPTIGFIQVWIVLTFSSQMIILPSFKRT